MVYNTKIEWADHTFNPWIGCTKVSPACDHCYAEELVQRFGEDFSTRRRTSANNWAAPRRWDRKAAKAGTRFRVFCASLADAFDNKIPEEWRTDLWQLIRDTPNLDWMLLTKRPQNIAKMLPADWGSGYPHVWLGTTVENQVEADRRIPCLTAVPAAVRFLSCEPLLGPLDLHALLYQPCPNSLDGLTMDPETGAYECCRQCDYTGLGNERALHWVICGGESGTDARPMRPSWAQGLRDQCIGADVPFFFKQWGVWAPLNAFSNDQIAGDEPDAVYQIGKKAAGRQLDGREWNQTPGSAAT